MPHKIAVIGGDGIGPEVTTVALDVMRAAGAAISKTASFFQTRYSKNFVVMRQYCSGLLALQRCPQVLSNEDSYSRLGSNLICMSTCAPSCFPTDMSLW